MTDTSGEDDGFRIPLMALIRQPGTMIHGLPNPHKGSVAYTQQCASLEKCPQFQRTELN
jgi:hypothetical protein